MTALGALRRAGILGINRRNAEYTLRWNPRSHYPNVDDKLRTKRLCERADIPTARLIAVVRHQVEARDLPLRLQQVDSFVLKPARGAMGNGILVVTGRDGDRVRSAGGRWVEARQLAHHASSILSGLYALGGQPDEAFVEERLELHPALRAVAADGVPDVRIVVHRGVPVMAMTRLPTLRSRGRANLHQGAVGAGIDLATGRTRHAVIGTAPARAHPDTGATVLDLPIPEFARALEIAVRASDLTGLGYVGADVVVDARYGPVILELNARPGLSIQIANRAGLLPRLRAVAAAQPEGRSLTERLALGREIGGRRVAG